MAETGCLAAVLDLCIEQGAGFIVNLLWREKATGTPIDITGYSARMKIVFDQGETSEELVLELTTGNGRIVLGGTAGTIDLFVTATDTTALDPAKFENTCYDLEMVPGAPNAEKVRRLIEGNVRLKTEKTT